MAGLEWKRPPVERQERFLQRLRDGGVDATLRREKGHDIEAACGQLRRQVMAGGKDREDGGWKMAGSG